MTKLLGPNPNTEPPIGVGPHPQPWPTGSQWDPELLAQGDRRNVLDRYRYWTVAAIKADLDQSRCGLHVAIENWHHDLNIGSIVRTANAFNVAGVHIVGKKDWNRRGAMVTDRYLHVHHHAGITEFAHWCAIRQLPIIGIDNIEGSSAIETTALPNPAMIFLGQEGPGLSDAAVAVCDSLVAITQYGSTRSMNASAAGAITIFAWSLQHRDGFKPGG